MLHIALRPPVVADGEGASRAASNPIPQQAGGGSEAGADMEAEAEAEAEARGGGNVVLSYVCKHCGHVEQGGHDEAARVMHTDYSDEQASYKQYATLYLRHDPTLPRTASIACPSKACSRPAHAPHRVIFIRYNDARLRYLYSCEHCGAFWRSGEEAPAPAPPASA